MLEFEVHTIIIASIGWLEGAGIQPAEGECGDEDRDEEYEPTFVLAGEKTKSYTPRILRRRIMGQTMINTSRKPKELTLERDCERAQLVPRHGMSHFHEINGGYKFERTPLEVVV